MIDYTRWYKKLYDIEYKTINLETRDTESRKIKTQKQKPSLVK